MSYKYRVNEQFSTVQGEGMHTGIPASFIRLQVCTVGCPWCDTKYTWKKGGVLKTVSEIVQEVQYEHVVITGGEPTYWNLDELIARLQKDGHFVQLETSGQNQLKGELRPNWVTWSPKENLQFKTWSQILELVDEVKFVVDESLTLEKVWTCLEPLFLHRDSTPWYPNIIMMPEGCPPTQESMQKALELTRALSELTTRPVRIMDRLQYRLGVR